MDDSASDAGRNTPARAEMEGAHNELCRHRWQPTFLEAHETGRGGNSGGHLFCMREGRAGYRLHTYDLEGNGFLANVLQRQQWELVLVALYLKCGEDLNSRANSTILGELAAFLQELAIPWIVVGDFQVPPGQWKVAVDSLRWSMERSLTTS